MQWRRCVTIRVHPASMQSKAAARYHTPCDWCDRCNTGKCRWRARFAPSADCIDIRERSIPAAHSHEKAGKFADLNQQNANLLFTQLICALNLRHLPSKKGYGHGIDQTSSTQVRTQTGSKKSCAESHCRSQTYRCSEGCRTSSKHITLSLPHDRSNDFVNESSIERSRIGAGQG